MPNLNSRLAKLEAQLAALHQQQVTQTDTEVMAALAAKYEAMDSDQLLAEYEALWTDPITNPRIIAEMQALEGLSADQLVSRYMQKIRG